MRLVARLTADVLINEIEPAAVHVGQARCGDAVGSGRGRAAGHVVLRAGPQPAGSARRLRRWRNDLRPRGNGMRNVHDNAQTIISRKHRF